MPPLPDLLRPDPLPPPPEVPLHPDHLSNVAQPYWAPGMEHHPLALYRLVMRGVYCWGLPIPGNRDLLFLYNEQWSLYLGIQVDRVPGITLGGVAERLVDPAEPDPWSTEDAAPP